MDKTTPLWQWDLLFKRVADISLHIVSLHIVSLDTVMSTWWRTQWSKRRQLFSWSGFHRMKDCLVSGLHHRNCFHLPFSSGLRYPEMVTFGKISLLKVVRSTMVALWQSFYNGRSNCSSQSPFHHSLSISSLTSVS